MPGPEPPEQQLAACRRRCRELAAQLAGTGFVLAGTVIRRYTRCTSPGCRCRADPPRLHGPYWQWTAKTAGKTVTRRLTDRQAALYTEWTAGNRRARQLLTEMNEISAYAAGLIPPAGDSSLKHPSDPSSTDSPDDPSSPTSPIVG
jgi:hypothetical protein